MEEVVLDITQLLIIIEEEVAAAVRRILLPHLVYCRRYLPTEQVCLSLPVEAVEVEVIGTQTDQTVVREAEQAVMEEL